MATTTFQGFDPRDLRRDLERWTRENCGWENRTELGMSQIWRCPAELYDRLTVEQRAFGQAARYMYEGRLHRTDMVARMRGAGMEVVEGRELVAAWDERFRGHPLGELRGDGRVAVVVVHSVSSGKFEEVKERNRALQSHYEQVQMYLLYGEYEEGVVVYKARETGEVWPVVVWPHEATQARLVEKAREVLAGVDGGERPECECGRHEG